MFTHIAYNPETLSGNPILLVLGSVSSLFLSSLLAVRPKRKSSKPTLNQLTAEAVEEALRYAAQAVKNEVLLDVKVGA